MLFETQNCIRWLQCPYTEYCIRCMVYSIYVQASVLHTSTIFLITGQSIDLCATGVHYGARLIYETNPIFKMHLVKDVCIVKSLYYVLWCFIIYCFVEVRYTIVYCVVWYVYKAILRSLHVCFGFLLSILQKSHNVYAVMLYGSVCGLAARSIICLFI